MSKTICQRKRQARAPSADGPCLLHQIISRGAKIIFFLAGSCHRLMAMATSARLSPSPGVVRAIGQIVAETVSDKSLCRRPQRSGLDDGEDLSFGNHVVEADQYGFELARGRRSHRNFHLHRFDECNVVAIADAAADFDGKRADAPGHLGHDLDVWHSVLRDGLMSQIRSSFQVAAGCERTSESK